MADIDEDARIGFLTICYLLIGSIAAAFALQNAAAGAAIFCLGLAVLVQVNR